MRLIYTKLSDDDILKGIKPELIGIVNDDGSAMVRAELEEIYKFLGGYLYPDGNVCDQFEVFWKAYPRKVGKAAAKKVWDAVTAKKNIGQEIIDAMIAQTKNGNALDPTAHEMQYLPHARTWLFQRRWEDELTNKAATTVMGMPAKMFYDAWQMYPGVKYDEGTELSEFAKMYPTEMYQIIPLLKPALEREIKHKQKLMDSEAFCPEWKTFRNWISTKSWKQTFPDEAPEVTHEAGPDEAKDLFENI